MAAERVTRTLGNAGEPLAFAARVSVILAALAVLSVAGLMWKSYLSGRSVDQLQLWLSGVPGANPPIPDGTVIAVQGDTCPRPWQTYLPAQGRFILGAGAGGALNLDANGVLTPVRKPGETGGRSGVELTVAQLPPHTHRFAIGTAVPNWNGPHPQTVATSPPVRIVVGMQDGEPSSGILAPYAIMRGFGWRYHEVVDALEPIGGVITSDRRHAAAMHDNIPPFLALTFCLYSNVLPAVFPPG